MVHETTTSLPGPDVLAQAKRFFAERVPHSAAFPESEGPTHIVLRGQGGEEVAIALVGTEGGTRVRASSLLFDQAIGRFFSTLPPAPEAA
jgi:hypothetical protein